MENLPIQEILPALKESLRNHPSSVLLAPPGAGKTTGVPLALLQEPYLEGKTILMLEPRKLAARGAAHRMASLLGEEVGEQVGYRIRFENRSSRNTRIEVVTEGILTRRIQSDPELTDVGLLIFDKFHERNLHSDLGLALALELQESFREDLRILVMSATLNGVGVSEVLGGAPIIESRGYSHPVEVIRTALPARALPEECAALIRRALRECEGDLLTFLPGAGEIRRTQRILEENLPEEIRILPLYGDLSREEQDLAILPDPQGRRKVILATNIAETSLTIQGIRTVVDSGLARVLRYDPASGLPRLKTERIALDSATQRAGRAGREAPGRCYRMWDEEEEKRRPATGRAEILDADLTSFLLEIAAWGAKPEELRFMDPPPPPALKSASGLLRKLGALNHEREITERGRRMVRLPLHPRLSHLLTGAPESSLEAAAHLVALLSERDLFRWRPGDVRNCDLRLRLEALHRYVRRSSDKKAPNLLPGEEMDGTTLRMVRRAAGEVLRLANSGSFTANRQKDDGEELLSLPDLDSWSNPGPLLCIAYPDRIARIREKNSLRYLMTGGKGAALPDPDDTLAGEEFLVIPLLEGEGREAKIRLAAPVTREELRSIFSAQIVMGEEVRIDPGTDRVIVRRVERLDGILLQETPLKKGAADLYLRTILEAIRQRGLASLPWGKEEERFRERILFLTAHGFDLVRASDDYLLEHLENWLGPHLAGLERFPGKEDLNLLNALKGLYTYEELRLIDREAPEDLPVPSGSRIPLEYREGRAILQVKLQEMFGLRETPRLAGGRSPLLLHLLSPARRPIQITEDLMGFWQRTYPEVKKELKGRYPKHPWPDDPLTAPPTRKTKRSS